MNSEYLIIKTILGACCVRNGKRYQKQYRIAPWFFFIASLFLVGPITISRIYVDEHGFSVILVITLFSAGIALITSHGVISNAFLTSTLSSEAVRVAEKKGVPSISWRFADFALLLIFVVSLVCIFTIRGLS
jgi:hypothetical protein